MQFIYLGEDGEASLQTVKSTSVCPSDAHGGCKETHGQEAELRG